MSAAVPSTETRSTPWFTVTPALEALVLGIVIAVAVASYFTITGQDAPGRLIAPPLVALLLIANLVPAIALLMLVGRRIARQRAARSAIGGGGRLHVRLVAVFSFVAAVPALLVTIFASLLFQYGIQFWYSDRARGMLENASQIARSSYDLTVSRWQQTAQTAADDTAGFLREKSIYDADFKPFFFQQIYFRSLSDGILFSPSATSGFQTFAVINPDLIDVEREVSARDVAALRAGGPTLVSVKRNRIQAVTMVPGADNLFLFTAANITDMPTIWAQQQRGLAIEAAYRDLLSRARALQLRFNAALLAISLLIVGFAVWIALAVADRLVRPVAELVDAARRVEGGDLTARVPDPRSMDEVGTLAKAFNEMTGRLQEQNTELVTANDQLETRRALIEAVMGGVSAGVVATGADGTISIANQSAQRLLGAEADRLVGRTLRDVSPDLAALAESGTREAVVQLGQGADPRTLAVRIARTDAGPILTFDDITQQVLDQRRAAWSDVARRIAHEIKNPLTPIQLAAERLQRRYGGKVEEGDTTFARLTETIVRQVGDLRRMVDEFSSFARMPKPEFHAESLVDTARQALFLHEVAHPDIAFRLVHDDPGITMVFDRRQIGQALTNIVKNAVEAIQAKGDGDHDRTVVMTLSQEGTRAAITVEDSGVGLPAERDRIAEPYMTTRARGTGLGLAIVKKIVEEHHGTIGFSDRPGGGTTVTMNFDMAALADRDEGTAELVGEGQLATLTRNRN